MPTWVSIILATAAVTGALGVIWTKVLKPGAKLIAAMDALVPLAVELVKQFQDAPEAFATLAAIAKQFEADSGKSLRDVINRLEAQGKSTAAAAGVLEDHVETARLLARKDREKIAQLIELLDALGLKVDAAAIERAIVADDLAAAQARADEQPVDADAGVAADAAARTAEDPAP